MRLAADTRLHPVTPRALDQRPSCETTAGLRDPTMTNGDATGILGRREPEMGHELTRIVGTIEGSYLGHHRSADVERDTTYGLDRLIHRL